MDNCQRKWLETVRLVLFAVSVVAVEVLCCAAFGRHVTGLDADEVRPQVFPEVGFHACKGFFWIVMAAQQGKTCPQHLIEQDTPTLRGNDLRLRQERSNRAGFAPP